MLAKSDTNGQGSVEIVVHALVSPALAHPVMPFQLTGKIREKDNGMSLPTHAGASSCGFLRIDTDTYMIQRNDSQIKGQGERIPEFTWSSIHLSFLRLFSPASCWHGVKEANSMHRQHSLPYFSLLLNISPRLKVLIVGIQISWKEQDTSAHVDTDANKGRKTRVHVSSNISILAATFAVCIACNKLGTRQISTAQEVVTQTSLVSESPRHSSKQIGQGKDRSF